VTPEAKAAAEETWRKVTELADTLEEGIADLNGDSRFIRIIAEGYDAATAKLQASLLDLAAACAKETAKLREELDVWKKAAEDITDRVCQAVARQSNLGSGLNAENIGAEKVERQPDTSPPPARQQPSADEAAKLAIATLDKIDPHRKERQQPSATPDVEWKESKRKMEAQLTDACTQYRLQNVGLREDLELAWGIIANASGGDWSKESQEWQDAANRWRDTVIGPFYEQLAHQQPSACPKCGYFMNPENGICTKCGEPSAPTPIITDCGDGGVLWDATSGGKAPSAPKMDIPKEWVERKAELEEGCEIGAGAPTPERKLPLVENYIRWFVHDILHGDEVHRQWLLEAADAFIEGKPMPPPRDAKGLKPAATPDVEQLAREWAARDQLWNCQPVVEANLLKFAEKARAPLMDVLAHLVHSNHGFKPDSCDACYAAQLHLTGAEEKQ